MLSVSSVSGGTTLTFTVTNFVNPYSAVPKSGFTISTADSSGNLIDSRTDTRVTVTGWASFSEADFDRSDGVTTVNELSQAYIYFKLNLPVDASCQIRIDFPSDQPLTTDLTTISGANLFATISST